MRVHTTNASAADLLSAWKQQTRTALAATLEHRHLSALEHYRHAQQLGLQLLVAESGDIADDDRIAAFVVAHLNLADALVEADQPAAASECLHEAQQTLMPFLQQDSTSQSLNLAICRHLPQLLAARAEHGAAGPHAAAGVYASTSAPFLTHPASNRRSRLASFEPVHSSLH
ncbi:hypothetical protein [Comamonas testosteroni]|uniref:hypothetical protein n=1 Tax=Comamonas testosteroni TaxID=285 RepID=UPI0026F286E9|nr:hypothetical protein [Comamonas testosteroni]WQD41521.1 hypothetical protein U0024_17370 [Comamonas testosteroni]